MPRSDPALKGPVSGTRTVPGERSTSLKGKGAIKQGPMSSPDSCPLGLKKMGVGMMKGKAVASGREELSKAAEDFPSGVSPSQSPVIQSRGWRIAMGCGPQPKFLVPLPFPLLP